jgi:2,3,4,5-tetrahydropyridine-2-carboxylate N-succinyltransferase
MPKTQKIVYEKWADVYYTAYPNEKNPTHYFIESVKLWNIKKSALRHPKSFFKDKPKNLFDVHIRLYLLSTLLVKPGEINMDGVVDILPTLYWVNGRESYTPDDFVKKFKKGERPAITPDKFPKIWMMCDIPNNVRIEDPNSVRYGAYLSPGTVVKSPGLVNANSGTMSSCMVEGRIPFGTLVREHTHIGAGAGIIGILSNSKRKKPIDIGRNCLLGANSECGINLGDNCTLEAGLTIMPGTKIRYYNQGFVEKFESDYVETKALNLSGEDNITFVRHSLYGYIAAIKNFKQVP